MNESIEIPEEILGVKLDEASVSALKDGKETELIKGFISSRTGKPFDAFLKVDAAGKIRYRFPERETKKTASSSKPKLNKLPTAVGGVELDEEDIEDLKAGRETKLIVGIESKKKGKYYDAFLRWHPEKGILFRFPGQDW